jgi:hypothetical protein
LQGVNDGTDVAEFVERCSVRIEMPRLPDALADLAAGQNRATGERIQTASAPRQTAQTFR